MDTAALLQKLFGTSNKKKLRPYYSRVEQINALEPEIAKMSDSQLQEKSKHFREKLAQGATLDDILFEAFAVVREVAKRVLNMRHFDVQLIGGIVLYEGKIAEMKTGEGKTLAATLPVYLNALSGKGVHVVTVNDYLAKRDSEWMGKIYNFLGLSVGLIQSNTMSPEEKKAAYNCDVVYGTNNEFGFDYLRDNMAVSEDQLVQRELNFAIVDEVDSILIDEARTPLIISGQINDNTEKYHKILKAAYQLEKETDFSVEEKSKHVSLTESGIEKSEQLLGLDSLYDLKEMDTAHILIQTIKALHMFKADIDYVVKSGEVLIVDEFTGRLMEGRRYSDGLHQAIEAKEGVHIQSESQTLASITFQNYFRMYNTLSGMTGTAITEASEFLDIYGLLALEIPTNKPCVRKDLTDQIYKSKQEKFEAVVREIKELSRKGQPILVGTIAIETSELLSRMLKKEGIAHNVLNAKYHAKEAEIVTEAGQKGRVTIATNMAGRGTDIVLGEGVVALGGLHIIGTERHESRRIDNQLRGRSGRQGDPGSSRFYISLEDDLMRLFGGARIKSVMTRLGMPDNEPIEHNLISRSIERAQKKVEDYHFGIRKQVLKYDDVMNRQRKTIYALRKTVLQEDSISYKLEEFIQTISNDIWNQSILSKNENDQKLILTQLKELVPQQAHKYLVEKYTAQEIESFLKQTYRDKRAEHPAEIFDQIEKIIMLKNLDTKWIDHLHNMDVLREGIGLRAYGQKDPLTEYKIEGFNMFQSLLSEIELETITLLYRVEIVSEDQVANNSIIETQADITNINYQSPDLISQLTAPSPMEQQGHSNKAQEKGIPVVKPKKIGRNDLCSCGSGKKYKHCCGK